MDETSDTNLSWIDQVIKNLKKLEHECFCGKTLAATVIVNLKRGTIKCDDEATLIKLAQNVLTTGSQAILLNHSQCTTSNTSPAPSPASLTNQLDTGTKM